MVKRELGSYDSSRRQAPGPRPAPDTQTVKGYIRSLFEREFRVTGLRTALCVGSLLFAINHGLALVRGDMTAERWVSVLLSYCMPYLVSVYGQYAFRCKFRHTLANAPALEVSQNHNPDRIQS